MGGAGGPRAECFFGNRRARKTAGRIAALSRQDEIKHILRLRRQGPCPCGEVMHMLEKHMRDTDEQIRHLQRFRKELAGTFDDWKKSGNEGIPGDVICGLIERTIRKTPQVRASRARKLRQSA